MESIPVGTRFGLWTVTGATVIRNQRRHVTCRCECGIDRVVALKALKNGRSKGCGCVALAKMRAAVTTHGASRRGGRTREYVAWKSMKTRCLNTNFPNYRYYGGPGITIDPLWLNSFETFLADMGCCPDGLTLERIDVRGHYTASNCKWATRAEQSRNRRVNKHITHNGRTQTLSEWAREIGVCRATLDWRLLNWPIDRAMTNHRSS